MMTWLQSDIIAIDDDIDIIILTVIDGSVW